jgi:predicted HTH transcriptional regulator
MATTELEQWLQSGEGLQLDFKYRLDNPYKTAQALCAFANAQGGRLLVGVKDNGTIKGVRAEEEWHSIEQAALLHTRPVLTPLPTVWKHSGKEVLEVEVKQHPTKPVLARQEDGTWLAWYRDGDENKRAPGLLIHLWKWEQKPREKVLKQSDIDWIKELSIQGEIPLNRALKAFRVRRNEALETLALYIQWNLVAWRITPGGILVAAVGASEMTRGT